MVEIVEEPNNGDEQPSTSRTGAARQDSARATPPAMTISQFVSANTLQFAMLAARVLTVFFAISYFVPFISFTSSTSSYSKAFAAAAATFALRLHQRLNGFSFSREFLMRLVVEDSFHYLIYSVVFLMAEPVSMALLPITLYAALNASSFLVKIMKETGVGSTNITARLENTLNTQTHNCLGLIACAEIFLVPLLVSMIFAGKASLVMPFVYYRFLTLRYASRRNPSTRESFAQMRIALDQVASSSSCPQVVRMLIHKSVAFISRLAPPVV